jgi:hypothetical protein
MFQKPIAPLFRNTILEDKIALAESKWLFVTQTGRKQRFKAERRNGVILKNKLNPLPTRLMHAVVPVARQTEAARIGDETKPFISFCELPGEFERAI